MRIGYLQVLPIFLNLTEPNFWTSVLLQLQNFSLLIFVSIDQEVDVHHGGKSPQDVVIRFCSRETSAVTQTIRFPSEVPNWYGSDKSQSGTSLKQCNISAHSFANIVFAW